MSDDRRLHEPDLSERSRARGTGGVRPAVGKDEWVARHDEQSLWRRSGPSALSRSVFQSVPWWAWLTLLVGVRRHCSRVGVARAATVRRVAFDTVLFMLLALGLNVVVGWGGLLDLGFIAFYGFGAYSYASHASEQFGLALAGIGRHRDHHFVAGAIVGLLVGLPSWRLSGDYLAIVTLFIYQLFTTHPTNGDDIFGVNVTGGVNGIVQRRSAQLLRARDPVAREGVFNVAYFYVAAFDLRRRFRRIAFVESVANRSCVALDA